MNLSRRGLLGSLLATPLILRHPSMGRIVPVTRGFRGMTDDEVLEFLRRRAIELEQKMFYGDPDFVPFSGFMTHYGRSPAQAVLEDVRKLAATATPMFAFASA